MRTKAARQRSFQHRLLFDDLEPRIALTTVAELPNDGGFPDLSHYSDWASGKSDIQQLVGSFDYSGTIHGHNNTDHPNLYDDLDVTNYLAFPKDGTISMTFPALTSPLLGGFTSAWFDVYINSGQFWNDGTKFSDIFDIKSGSGYSAGVDGHPEVQFYDGGSLSISFKDPHFGGPWALIYVYIKTDNDYILAPLPTQAYAFNLTIDGQPPPPQDPPRIQINGPVQADNITLFNPAHDQQPEVRQNATLTVGNITSPVTVSLGPKSPKVVSFSAPGATVNEDSSVITLDPRFGSNQVVTITPRGDSNFGDDVEIDAVAANGQKATAEKMTVVKVTIPEHIRHAGDDDLFGKSFPDRIPPRVPNKFDVTVEPDLTGTEESVSLDVLNKDVAGAGRVYINGKETGAVQLKSQKNSIILQTPDSPTDGPDPNQTELGHSGQLKLVALIRGETQVETKGFSVAAEPIGIYSTFYSKWQVFKNNKDARGFIARLDFLSDSDVPLDLDAVYQLEDVQVDDASRSGIFKKMNIKINQQPDYNYPLVKQVDGKLTATVLDVHDMPLALIKNPRWNRGKFPKSGFDTNQLFLFLDIRTGAYHVTIPNSGFKIMCTAYRRQGRLRADIWQTATPVSVGLAHTSPGLLPAGAFGIRGLRLR